jgi:glycosyltransferase involved in cell wall biosynthesis
MNILFVLYRDFIANSSNPLVLYARELHLSGHDCAVAVPENLETISQHENVAFRPVLFSDALNAPASVFPDGRPADVIHACTPREVVRKFVTAYMAKQPTALVIYLEDNEGWISTRALDLTEVTLYQQTERAICERLPDSLSHPFRYESFVGLADAAVVVQDKLRAFVPPWVYCTTVIVGADVELFSPRLPSPSVRMQYGLSENEKVIVYHGSLNEFNRPALQSLCAAVGLIRQRGIPCRLLRTGAYPLDFLGELPPDTALAISDLGLVPRSTLPNLLALADVFVQPGKPDPFEDLRLPGKIGEFLAMGRPVIMPNANIAGLFKDGVDAILLQTGDPDEIATRCIELFSDPQRAAEIGQAGRLMAERYFDARVQAHLLEDTYNAALKVFDAVIARDVWNAAAGNGPVALQLSQKLKRLAECRGMGMDANMLREHARYIDLAQQRVSGLEASLTARDQEIANLKQESATLRQALTESSRIPSSRWRFASDHVKATLKRLKTRVRHLANLFVL